LGKSWEEEEKRGLEPRDVSCFRESVAKWNTLMATRISRSTRFTLSRNRITRSPLAFTDMGKDLEELALENEGGNIIKK